MVDFETGCGTHTAGKNGHTSESTIDEIGIRIEEGWRSTYYVCLCARGIADNREGFSSIYIFFCVSFSQPLLPLQRIE